MDGTGRYESWLYDRDGDRCRWNMMRAFHVTLLGCHATHHTFWRDTANSSEHFAFEHVSPLLNLTGNSSPLLGSRAPAAFCVYF